MCTKRLDGGGGGPVCRRCIKPFGSRAARYIDDLLYTILVNITFGVYDFWRYEIWGIRFLRIYNLGFTFMGDVAFGSYGFG